ncbi:unnamed protein product [Pipistrellus nathusii]|uniref:Uncharacterized protein n=1 Tax=Pipistrellus nathusii TaxID=59473 RepID=A0ABP0AKI4_PIPNA
MRVHRPLPAGERELHQNFPSPPTPFPTPACCLRGYRGGEPECSRLVRVWGSSCCLYPFFFPLLPWSHWGKEIRCSDNISNYETNLNPVLSDTLFVESHQ